MNTLNIREECLYCYNLSNLNDVPACTKGFTISDIGGIENCNFHVCGICAPLVYDHENECWQIHDPCD